MLQMRHFHRQSCEFPLSTILTTPPPIPIPIARPNYTTLFNPSNLSPVLLPAPSGKPLPLLLATLKKPTKPVSVLSSTFSQIHLILTNPANQHLLLAQIPAIIPCVFERIVSDNDGVRKGVADVLSALFANASLHLVHSPITAYISPFLPLLLAYTTSALNSLYASNNHSN